MATNLKMNDSIRNVPARAFTLIELLGVLCIMAILGLMTIPAVMAAMQRASINRFVSDLERVCANAQAQARATPKPIKPTIATHYGVMVAQNGSERFIALITGRSTTDATIEAYVGQPVLQVRIPASVEVLTADGGVPSLLQGRIAWFYRFGDGAPLASAAQQKAVGIGTPLQEARPGARSPDSDYWNFSPPLPAVAASPVCTALLVRIRGSTTGTTMAIYQNGMVATSPADPVVLASVPAP